MIKDPFAKDTRPKDVLERELREREMQEMMLRGVKKNAKPWLNYFKQAPREKGFVDHKYPDFVEKGEYIDGCTQGAAFLREEPDVRVPFKLAFRSLRKTDKNLSFGEDVLGKA